MSLIIEYIRCVYARFKNVCVDNARIAPISNHDLEDGKNQQELQPTNQVTTDRENQIDNKTRNLKTAYKIIAHFPYYCTIYPIIYLCFYINKKTESDSNLYCLNHPWNVGIYTYALQHSSIYHAALNAVSTIMYGSLIEIHQQTIRVGLVHTAGILVGALSDSWHCKIEPSYCNPRDEICLMGASAGFYALLGSYVGHIVLNWSDMYTSTKGLIWRWTFIIMGICGLASDITFSSSLQMDSISYYAHFGGFVGGLTLSPLIYKQIKKSKEHALSLYMKVYIFISLLGFLSYTVITIINTQKIKLSFLF